MRDAKFFRNCIYSRLEPQLRQHGFTVSRPDWPRGIRYYQPYPWADERVGPLGNVLYLHVDRVVPFFQVWIHCPIAAFDAKRISRVVVWNRLVESPLNEVKTLVGMQPEMLDALADKADAAARKAAERDNLDVIARIARMVAASPFWFPATSPETLENSIAVVLDWFDMVGWAWLDDMLSFARSFPSNPFPSLLRDRQDNRN